VSAKKWQNSFITVWRKHKEEKKKKEKDKIYWLEKGNYRKSYCYCKWRQGGRWGKGPTLGFEHF